MASSIQGREMIKGQHIKLGDALTHMKAFCVLCWLFDGELTGTHHAGECYEDGRAGQMFDYTSQYRVPNGTYLCYGCLVHLYKPPSQHDPKNKGGCTWSNILPATAWASWMVESVRARVIHHFHLHEMQLTLTTYTEWLLRKADRGQLSNISRVFLFLYETSEAILEKPK